MLTRPASAQARVRAIERIAGETIRAVRAMTTAKTTDATEATCRAANTPRAARTTMSATSTEAEAVAWDMVGAVSALTMLFMGFSLRMSSRGNAKRAPHASVFVNLLVRAARVGSGIKKGR